MKQKRLCITLVLFTLFVMLSVCGKNGLHTDVCDRYKMNPLPDSAYVLEHDTAAVCIYDNKIYAAKDTIGYYDVQNNMEYHELWRIPVENGAWEAEISCNCTVITTDDEVCLLEYTDLFYNSPDWAIGASDRRILSGCRIIPE